MLMQTDNTPHRNGLTDRQSPPDTGRKSPAIRVLKCLVIAIVLYFVARKVVDNWQEVISYRWDINPLLLALSVAAHLVTFAMLSRVWCYLIAGFGHRVPFPAAFKISYIANLGRYIPGKIWPVFGMVYLARKIEVSEEAAVASWGLAQMFAIPASFLACLLMAVFQPDMFTGEVGRYTGAGVYLTTALIFLVSLGMILVPNRVLLLFNLLLRLLRRPQISFRLSKTAALKVYLGYFLSWLMFGFSFWLFLNAVIDRPPIPVTGGIMAFVLAYQVGYLTIFSPGGLGVRELVLTTLLTPFVGPVAAGVAVASRLWNILSEIVAALVAFKIKLQGS